MKRLRRIKYTEKNKGHAKEQSNKHFFLYLVFGVPRIQRKKTKSITHAIIFVGQERRLLLRMG